MNDTQPTKRRLHEYNFLRSAFFKSYSMLVDKMFCLTTEEQ